MNALIYCPNKGFIYRRGEMDTILSMTTSQPLIKTSILYSIKRNE
jgi:hypothetical protein